MALTWRTWRFIAGPRGSRGADPHCLARPDRNSDCFAASQYLWRRVIREILQLSGVVRRYGVRSRLHVDIVMAVPNASFSATCSEPQWEALGFRLEIPAAQIVGLLVTAINKLDNLLGSSCL